MKQVVIKLIAPLLCLIGLWSCSDDEPSLSPDNKQWTEKVVAVVLPMEKGLDVHWKRTLGMFTTNFERAFKNHEAGIRLKFEYYDEAKTDVRELARSLAFNDEVYAVIGGLYSSNAAILAAELTIVGKTFFTLATAEQLVRAYASTGYLWAMTETDITQCEVLLSKVINYEGKSVALLVKENDGYGQTFIDWFAFQARELGLENMGCYAYTSDNIADVSVFHVPVLYPQTFYLKVLVRDCFLVFGQEAHVFLQAERYDLISATDSVVGYTTTFGYVFYLGSGSYFRKDKSVFLVVYEC